MLTEHHYTVEDAFGMTKRQIERIVKRVAQRAAIAKPVSPHVLRHTFAVSCIKRGISTLFRPFLGTIAWATTEIYMNLSPKDAIREFQAKW